MAALAVSRRLPCRRAVAALRTAGAVLVLPLIAASCGPAPPAETSDDRALEAAVADVEAGRRTTPLIHQPEEGGDARVTFLVKSSGDETPRIVSDATGWGGRPDDSFFDETIGTMSRLGSSDWYWLEARVAPGARIEYLVVEGAADYHLDPNNPRHTDFSGGHLYSVFTTSGYVPPPELEGPRALPAGTVTQETISSRALGGPRRVIVYLPPGFRDGMTCPVAVFHSGVRVAEEGEAPRTLDWLIAHRAIEPLVAIFLESYVRGDPSNHEGPPLRAFLNHEVPSWIASRHPVLAREDRWAILAISYGAKDALDAALDPAGPYRRLGLLIPGRRLRPADLERLVGTGGHRLRAAVLAGRYDTCNLPTARATRRALTAAGHAVDYIEVPEGHTPTTWRNHLRDVLISLFPPGGAPPGG
jgi:enterochelin esterase-like enzyme